MVFVAQSRIVNKAILIKSFERLQVVDLVSNHKAGHSATASFGKHRHDLELRSLVYIEVRLHDSYLFLHALPVKKMLKLLGSQMEQYAIIGFDTINKAVGEPLSPPCKERLAVCSLQLYLAFQQEKIESANDSEQNENHQLKTRPHEDACRLDHSRRE